MPSGPPGFWNSLALSADGSIVSAVAYPGGGIYVLDMAPSLSLTAVGENALITWPDWSSAAGLALQENFDLSPNHWTAANGSPGLTNGLYQLIASRSSNTNRFYRLQGP